jgi:hypothetical protein
MSVIKNSLVLMAWYYTLGTFGNKGVLMAQTRDAIEGKLSPKHQIIISTAMRSVYDPVAKLNSNSGLKTCPSCG